MNAGRIRILLLDEAKADADNTYRDLDYSGYYKTESSNCLYNFFFK